MADFSNIKQEIDEKIVPYNNAQLITGKKLNDTLKDIVDAVNEKKVDAEEGKGLSTNDFTNTLKAKVEASIGDAPSDGQQYARKNGSWAVVQGGGGSVDIIDDLTSERSDAALSAKQGKVLKGLVDGAALGVVSLDGRMTSVEGNIDALEAAVADKADKNGNYPDMRVGEADNVTPRGDGIPAFFTYRPSGGRTDLGDGQGIIQALRGRTIKWQQLTPNADFATLPIKGEMGYNWDVSGVTITKEGTSLKVDFTATGMYFSQEISVKEGHKYYFRYNGREGTNGEYALVFPTSNLGNIHNYGRLGSGISYIITAAVGTEKISLRFYNTQIATVFLDSWIAFDLTEMGLADIISTPADFEALYRNLYYPHSATPQLISFAGEKVKTIGFQRWDEQWESGSINSIGVNTADANRIRSKNYISILPNTAYYAKAPQVGIDLYFYDSNKNFISTSAGRGNIITTSPVNATYMRFRIGSSGTPVTTYGNDICINLSHSGKRNGQYEPYWESEVNLPDLDFFGGSMKGIGAVKDEWNATGRTQRIGTRAYQAGDEDDSSVLTDGTTTYYVLATPVTDNVPLPMLKERVSDWGTEELLPATAEGATPTTTPFEGTILYLPNTGDLIYNLPKNYISVDSLEALLAALKAANKISNYTMTWDDTTGKYSFTIS